MMTDVRAAVLVAFLILIMGWCALNLPTIAPAFERGQWNHDGETSAWFKSLKNDNGLSCCDYADGSRLEDPEWHENNDGSYSIFAHGAWHTVDRWHVVKGTNRVGYAILWWPVHWPEPSCFLPGVRG